MSEFDFKPELKKTIPWRLAAIFLLLTGVIIMIGSYYYKSERNRIFKEQEKILSAIASLKVRQIGQWYNEKLADAVVIKDNEPLESRIKQFLKDENQTGIRKEITIWLEALNKQYDYNSVAVLDTLLKVKIASSNADLLADDSIRDELNNVIRYHKIIMTDLHKTGTSHAIRMDLLVPLLDPLSKEQKTIGLVILCIDPDKILFPLVQSWPTPSKSSETLILRREGDSVIYLNELRHRKNTALNLKFPLSNVTLLATKAVNGFEGVTEGTDYRKIPVVGALSKIPGLPWYMVAKTDKEEILAPFKRYSIITVVVIILLIILNALVSGYWIWAQRAKMYRRQIKDEIALRESNEKLIASEERFRSLYENATIGIYRTTPDGKILLANPALVRMLGFSSFEDLAHRNLEVEGYEPDYPRAKFLKILEKEDKIIGLESAWHQRNGNNLYVRESASVIRDEEGKILYYDGNVEDITYRKQVDEALRESEKRLREAQEMAHLGFWLWDIKTGNVEWSDEVYKIFCLDPATFKPKIDSILELSPWPEDNQRDKELINRAIESHNPGTYEQKFLRPDKSIGYYYSTFRGSYDNNGDLVSIVGTILDITERKITEVALRESEERFSKSFRTSPISFIIANMEDGRIIEVNDAFTTISGYTRDEALNNTTLNLKIWVHEDDRKHIIDSLSMGKAILHKETLLRSKEGKIAIVLLSAQVIKLANRNCIISSIEDITKRKEAEDELRIQSEIMSHMAEAVYLVRIEDSVIVYANSRFEELFGYGSGEMTGKPVSIINAPAEKSPEETATEIIGELEKNGFWTGEVLNIKKDGTVFWSHANVAIFDHSKFGKVLVSVQQDITDRKNAESQIKKLNEELEGRVIQRTELLETANKELEAFSYSVSHDLRAPLRSVHGFTKILLEDYEASLDEEGKRICGIISASATQMGELIDDLLSFSRIGRSRLNPSEIDMKKMAKLIFEGMTSPTERKRIKMNIGRLPKAFGDVTLFGQVWTNLISNAIKYTSKNDLSEINIGSKVDGKMITYFIKDNGVGFDMQYAHKLFGVFQRLHSEAEFEGNGVGLAIIQRIILKHGGKVWAEGEVGKGATFYFSLPVQDINKKTHGTRHTTHG